MKTNYRVLLIVAVFGITLFTAAVNPHGSVYAVGDRVGVNLAPGDDLFAGLRWRNIGPFHGGRIAAVTGAVGQPGVFYIGAPAGGIWKTTSAGVTWAPTGDRLLFSSITGIDSVELTSGSLPTTLVRGDLNLEWSWDEVSWQPRFD